MSKKPLKNRCRKAFKQPVLDDKKQVSENSLFNISYLFIFCLVGFTDFSEVQYPLAIGKISLPKICKGALRERSSNRQCF
jgi:hypothetical protein